MTRLHFAIPGDLESPTGGYVYDRRIMAELPKFGIEVVHVRLPSGFPFPSAEEIAEAARLLREVPADAVLMIDGLAFGALPESALSGIRAPIVAMLHHPLGLETGLSEQQKQELLASERAALRTARHIIVTSPVTARTLAELSFAPPPPITVAKPGTDPAPRATRTGQYCQIVSVGSVVPRKGYDVLVEALARIPHRGWRCTIIGDVERDRGFVERVTRLIDSLGLAEQVQLTGALPNEALGDYYAGADIFALPSRYEGYGMAFAGALAYGLPIVAARAGAVSDTVPADAGLLVAPDDAEAFSEALHALISDETLRRKLSDAAWGHAQTLPRWHESAGIIAGVIKGLAL
jgi:glycosyltransferase involved in cell wall biosynthesis